MSYKNFPLAVFWYSPAVMALYPCAKIHSLSFSNKFSTEVGVLGLCRFLANFSFFWAPKSLRIYISKVSKLRPWFYIFPDNFGHSIRIWKKYLTWGSWFGGYSVPKTIPEAEISKFSLFRKAIVPKRLDLALQCRLYLVQLRARY